MGFELDYIYVGEGQSSGDAIAILFGDLLNPNGTKFVFVIDGGTKDSGQRLVDHIIEHYKTHKVDAVFVTHQDSDHSSGLSIVLEQLDVQRLYMHVPWDHEKEMQTLMQKPIVNKKFEEKLQKSFEHIRDLEEIAFEKNIPIEEPFTGMQLGGGLVHVLGPTKEYYEFLLAQYDKTPEANMSALDLLSNIIGVDQANRIYSKAEELIEWARETLDPETETLDDSGVTSPENNSSMIMMLTIDEHKFLFTGDAGIPALTAAFDYADKCGISLKDLHLFHVPHHGSKRNVGKTVLNRVSARFAQISAGQKAPKHPAKKVVNALIRRKHKVYATKGKGVHYYYNSPDRIGWSAAQSLEFNELVEK